MLKNRTLTILIICAVLISVVAMSGYTPPSENVTLDNIEVVPVYKNGLYVSDGINVEGTTYTYLRSFTDAIGVKADISWDSETDTAYVKTDGLDLSIGVGNQYMVANDRYLYIPTGAINYNGSVIVPIRELAKVFNVEIDWHPESASITIDTADLAFIQSGDEFYNEDDLYWMSRLVNSESGNQPLDGKIAVGNVVMNRVISATCPDSIYGVIFDPGQFSVVSAGTINNTPNDESVIAAKICLEGYNIVENALFFINPAIAENTDWFFSREHVITIADHSFFA